MAAIIMWALLYIAACIWTMKRELQKNRKRKEKIIWGYAEQRLAPGLHALLQGSFQSGASRGCKSYAGAGLTWQCGKQKVDCSPTMPDFPLHTNGPVNLHGNPLFRQRIYTTHLTFRSASGSTLSDWLIALQLCAPDYLTFIILRQIHQ